MPIGVFDSGVGGLSVLAALRRRLPHHALHYVADIAHAPYGERGDGAEPPANEPERGQLRERAGHGGPERAAGAV